MNIKKTGFSEFWMYNTGRQRIRATSFPGSFLGPRVLAGETYFLQRVREGREKSLGTRLEFAQCDFIETLKQQEL